jgi:Asp-tRNA(Asn)/Glu-tRNA(Gln) amidotransferase A subunit family amidase
MRPHDTPSPAKTPARLHRRRLLHVLAGLGVGTVAFQRSLAAMAADKDVSADMIRQAEWIAGIELTEEQRRETADSVERAQRSFRQMRAVPVTNNVAPAISFEPAPWLPPDESGERGKVEPSKTPDVMRPKGDEELAFMPVSQLASLIRGKQISSLELTRLYLERLKKYDPALLCVVNLTEELALKQAKQADKEIAAGKYRGPLHGIPWGAKDLIAYPGYKTTWGAIHLKDQVIDVKATVAQRLEEAGAVLVAKLSLGALAQGDLWFHQMTRNPWNPKQGSSGSSAGSACAAAAGLVGFAIGSETLGSIVSPSTRCGTSGLRPTFGRVSRHGCMTLAWSMDKLGPICRSVEDCALVFGAIHGHDGLDAAAVTRPFHWPGGKSPGEIRVGYFDDNAPMDQRPELNVLRELGFMLRPINLPGMFPIEALTIILNAEAAAAFDNITRDKIDDGLNTWPRTFRQGQFIPAVEYLRANRIRSMVMQEMRKVWEQVDVYVDTMTRDLTVTNLTGHPSVVLPNGFDERRDGFYSPRSIVFTGNLYAETDLLTVARAYQVATGHHLRHPDMSKVKPMEAEEED